MSQEPIYEGPNPERAPERIIVRERGSGGWWLAALVAVIAVAGFAYMLMARSSPTDLQSARDQGAAEASLDTATAAAQMAAAQATVAAQSAVDGAARATDQAAAATEVAAQQTAQAAQSAAADASNTLATDAPPAQ